MGSSARFFLTEMQTGKEKLPDVLDVHSWHEFIKAIMNAGYLSGDLILSGNAIFYTYALYLIAKHRFNASYNENMHLTSLWFFYASLISLYTGSFESTVENHLNTIKNLKTLDEYKEFILSRVNERLTNDYFDITLVGSEGLAVSGRGNNAWNAYVASLNIMNAKILFSKSNLLVSKSTLSKYPARAMNCFEPAPSSAGQPKKITVPSLFSLTR